MKTIPHRIIDKNYKYKILNNVEREKVAKFLLLVDKVIEDAKDIFFEFVGDDYVPRKLQVFGYDSEEYDRLKQALKDYDLEQLKKVK